ncbi:MAG: 1-(5-phosphoribosyl)-5-[(5-phosphoribosylamino)methylideneamino]imidazole-4-carboxamide isomerase [Candidatus Omnitrophota bacterium]|nr:1-(5-phosphoribosyl)-5-[(5-phosphoribosylamino)methylideneamino]imidazole-4-carboxamide isomerase [Candidatus Omnitrophota bacterium]
MLIIPAIDLKDGKVVRLFQGEYSREKIYSVDPVQVARQWKQEGAKLIHVVDLDGAACGRPKNLEVVAAILKEAKVRVEFGGGVRSEETIKKVLKMGVFRVVIGTLALENYKALYKLAKKYKDKLLVSLDVKNDGSIATRGWKKKLTNNNNLADIAKNLASAGIKRIVYTDIERDGTLGGLRLNLLSVNLNILSKYKLSTIIAGGVSTTKDILNIRSLALDNKIEGVIVGKALYEGRFNLKEALKIA